MSLGDILPGEVLTTDFSTFPGGVPTTWSGSPTVAVFKDDSTTPETTGVTLTTNFNSVTGWNHIKVDTSTDGAFYSAGSNFRIIATGGTVGSNSMSGWVIDDFSIADRSALLVTGSGTGEVQLNAGFLSVNMYSCGGVASVVASGAIPNAVAGASGGLLIAGSNAATTFATLTITTGNLNVNVAKFGGTTVTARDIGASVLLSSGTGTGQLSLSSGTVTITPGSFVTATLGTVLMPSNVTQWLSQGVAASTNGVPNVNTIAFNNSAVVATSGKLWALDTAGNTLVTLSAIEGTYPTNFADLVISSGGILDDTAGTTKLVSTLVLVSGSTYQFTTQALANAPSGGGSAPTVEEIDAQLSSTHGSGQWGSSSGSGAFTVTVTVTDTSSAAVPNANVRVTSGITSLVATTNSSGVATFALDAATWAIAITKPGYTFTPSTIVVTTSANFAETLTPVVIPAPPSGSNLCNVFGFFETLSGAANQGPIAITFALSVPSATATGGWVLIGTPISAVIAGGQLCAYFGGPNYVPLARNDSITPSGSTYLVTCAQIGLNAVAMTLAATTYNIEAIVPT